MNSLTLLVCIVAVAVIPEFISGKDTCTPEPPEGKGGYCVKPKKGCKPDEESEENRCPKSSHICCCIKSQGKCGGPNQPPCQPKYDKSAKVGGLGSSSQNETDPKGVKGMHVAPGGCYWMYTLTSKEPFSGTDALYSFQFWRWTVFGWQWSPWILTNNLGDDREPGQWDLYGPYAQGIGGLPADWLYVKQTSMGFFDWWQIENIFMWNKCANKVYMYYCGGCWVTTTGTWIQKTYP